MCALVQLFYVHNFVPETLLAERRVAFKPSDVNPLSFLRLFGKSRTLRVLAIALFFNCCAEGKDLAAKLLRQSFNAQALTVVLP